MMLVTASLELPGVPAKRVVHLVIPGDPVSKARPRFATNGNGTVYTPKTTTQAEGVIADAIRLAYPALRADMESSFRVRIRFFSATWQRRDVDNMSKLVFDACNRVVWEDDSQVSELSAAIVRGVGEPSTVLTIWALPEPAYPQGTCEWCGTSFRMYPSWEGRRFCTYKCSVMARRRQGPRPICLNCEKEIDRAPSPRVRFCSVECRNEYGTVEMTCAQCGISYRKQKSLAGRPGRNYCSLECKLAYRLAHPAKGKWGGTCTVCGQPTSKKTYKRCDACQMKARIQQAQARTLRRYGGRTKKPRGAAQ